MKNTIIANRYTLSHCIGSGGASDVYLATDNHITRNVAIKILKPHMASNPEFKHKFTKEAQAIAKLTHPNIVQVFDAGEQNITINSSVRTIHYIVMEYIDGQPMSDFIKNHRLGGSRLTPQLVDTYMRQLLDALDYSHSMGVIHRDIKPANIMITKANIIKITDFGIAKITSSTDTTQNPTQHIWGTASYFSPEQAKGQKITGQSDLYSAGVILYEILTGKLPFDADSAVSMACMHISQDPTPPSILNPNVSEYLASVSMTALEKDPTYRYSTAKDFYADLSLAIHGSPPTKAQQLQSTKLAATAKHATNTSHLTQQQPKAIKMLLTFTIVTSFIAVIALSLAAVWLYSDFQFHQSLDPTKFKAVKINQIATPPPQTNRTTIPNILGLSTQKAKELLESSHLRLGSITTQDSTQPTPGIVINTRPQIGTQVPEDSMVNIYVSNGRIQIPSLLGKSLDAAKNTLRNLGLAIIQVQNPECFMKQNLPIIKQTPSYGSIQKGSPVTIYYCSGSNSQEDVNSNLNIPDNKNQ